MSINKRMIYIWDENLEFYNNLKNKSDVINTALQQLRIYQEAPPVDKLAERLQRIDERSTN